MIIVNKGQRIFTIKDGQGSKDLAPLCETEVEKEDGELLVTSFPCEIFAKVEEVIADEELSNDVESEEVQKEVKTRGRKKK